MPKLRAVIVLALVLAGLQVRSASASTVTVYSDFGAGNSYNTLSGWVISGPSATVGSFEDAFPFTPSGDFSFVSANIGELLESGTNGITVTLAANNSGTPGAAIESLTAVGSPNKFVSTIVEADSVTHPELHSGVEYWLVVSTTGSNVVQWDWNSIGVTGDWQEHNGGAWSHNTSAAGAFSINGTPIVPVPEPASLVMFASGILAAIGFSAAYTRRAGKRSA